MKIVFSLFSLCMLFATETTAQTLSSKQVDSLVELTLKTFNVPGIAVGIIKDGKLIHAKGYGIANLETGRKVDEYTLFGIASNSASMVCKTEVVIVPFLWANVSANNVKIVT